MSHAGPKKVLYGGLTEEEIVPLFEKYTKEEHALFGNIMKLVSDPGTRGQGIKLATALKAQDIEKFKRFGRYKNEFKPMLAYDLYKRRQIASMQSQVKHMEGQMDNCDQRIAACDQRITAAKVGLKASLTGK